MTNEMTTIKKLIVFTLALLLNLPAISGVPGQSQQTLKEARQSAKPKPPKLAPDLEEILAQDDEDTRQALQGKTLAEVRQARLAGKSQGKPRTNQTEDSETDTTRRVVNGMVLPSVAVGAEERQSFIVQLDGSTPNVVWQEKLARLGGRVKQQHGQMGLLTIEAPRAVIRQIAADGSIGYVSPDRPVNPQGHLENATGTEQIRGLVGGTTMNGQGVGVAILDSGIDETHKLILPSSTHPGVVYRKDFTGQAITTDAHGHGTHVASLTIGDKGLKTGKYEGVAPGAKLISLRVLNSNGVGSASAVIAALDWCVTNKNLVVNGASLNLRVINMSLGANAKDSYVNDPLCLATRRAHNAGIVVIAAAGNDGKGANGQKIYGGIHSPGIDPSVITVGASNSYGTDARSDDTVTTYSSRGPTRGYTTVNGVRKYDNLGKTQQRDEKSHMNQG
jgi:serine protease AprX